MQLENHFFWKDIYGNPILKTKKKEKKLGFRHFTDEDVKHLGKSANAIYWQI